MLSGFSSKVDNVRSDPLTDRVAPVTTCTSQTIRIYFTFTYTRTTMYMVIFEFNFILISIIHGNPEPSGAYIRGSLSRKGTRGIFDPTKQNHA